MQIVLLLSLLAIFGLECIQKNSKDSLLYDLGFTQAIYEDSLPFGLVEKMWRRLLLVPLANRFNLANVPFGPGFTHMSSKDSLCSHLGFTRRSSKDGLYFGSGFI